MTNLKQCTKCKKFKKKDKFYFYKKTNKETSHCKECIREKMRILRKNNPEKHKERNKKWWSENRDKQKIYDQRRREKYPDYNKLSSRKWRKNNRLKSKFGEIKNSARRKKHNFSLTIEEYSTFFNKPCFYCNEPKQIGLDRVNNKEGYTFKNVVTCCGKCNTMKLSMPISSFLKHVEKIIKRKKIILKSNKY